MNEGTQFDFSYAPDTSIEQIIGFEMAGEIWSSYLDDDVTVRIYVESTAELPDEVIGAALPGKKRKVKYDDLRDQLQGDLVSDEDYLAFDNLPSAEKDDDKFTVLIDGRELDETKEFRISNANAKSLGLMKDNHKKLDGYILVNDLAGDSPVGWNYDALRSDNIQGNEIDFLSVAMHEIGHVLGFVSGIDDNDWLEVLTESREKEEEIEEKDFKFASPLDLYRYSESTYSTGKLDLSTGGDPFFSIDGGSTRLGNFANGEYTDFNGDGYQASHWQQNSSQGIMDPILPVGERRDISSLDITAMDVVGWDINTGAAPNWEEMYNNAVADAETATIGNREKDVEKLVKESGYDVRFSRGARVRIYSWQLGFWQFTTADSAEDSTVVIDEPEIVSDDNIGNDYTEVAVNPEEVEVDNTNNLILDSEITPPGQSETAINPDPKSFSEGESAIDNQDSQAEDDAVPFQTENSNDAGVLDNDGEDDSESDGLDSWENYLAEDDQDITGIPDYSQEQDSLFAQSSFSS